MDSIILIGNNPLTTNNSKSSIRPIFVTISLLNLLALEKKKSKILQLEIHVLSFFWGHDQVKILRSWLLHLLQKIFNKIECSDFTCFFMVVMPLIKLMKPFLHLMCMANISRWSSIIMTYNTSHNLVLKKVHGLVSVHLKICPSK
jgi:hypothetical protein